MQVQSSDFFISAYYTRLAERRKSGLSGTAGEGQKTIDLASISGGLEKYGDAVKVTLSEEAKRFLLSDEARLKVEKDTYEMYAAASSVEADPNDPFSARPNDQWSVFSEYLYDNGFYDSLSDGDVDRVETLLKHITGGLDSLYMNRMDLFSEIRTQLDSNEAKLEWESSTAALQMFGEKFVAPELKEGFDKLVDAYYAHNRDIVKNHQSIGERFNAARAKLPEASKRRMQEDVRNTLSDENAERARNNVAVMEFFGGLKHTEEESDAHSAFYAEAFKQLKDGMNLQDAMGRIVGEFVSYATGGSSDRKMQDYVKDSAFFTFERIRGYWSELL